MAFTPYTKTNKVTQALSGGVTAEAPMVALAYSFAVMTFTGTSANAGQTIKAECGGNSLTITLDSEGKGTLSLLPFIRAAVLASGVFANPLYCDTTETVQSNKMRGYIDVALTKGTSQPVSVRVHYIFGNYAPKGEAVTDVYLDYCSEGGTWFNYDNRTNYNAGVPYSFEDNWCDANKLAAGQTGDFTLPLNVAWFYGKDAIRFDTINYHFRYDCRTSGVIKLRWLDANGNINTRKFTMASKAHGAAVEDSWRRPHDMKQIVSGYDFGNDEWASVKATESVVVGDDNIPMTHYSFVRSLVSSVCVEALIGGVWTRCNVSASNFTADPRKAAFSITLTLVLPTDEPQQF